MKKKTTAAAAGSPPSRIVAAPNPPQKPAPDNVDFYQQILDNLDAIIFVADIQSHEILYANNYARSLLGHITGKTCWQALQGKGAEPCSFCATKYLFDDGGTLLGSLNHEIQNRATRGWYDIHERPFQLPDGRNVRIHLATDITDKKEIDEKLRKSEEKYRTVADYTYDWECWLNKERNFEYISPSCQRITGYGVAEFLADPALVKKIIHPDDQPAVVRHHDEAFQSPHYSHLEYRIITKDGAVRWISHYCQPVYSEDGTFLGRRASNREITRKKEAEQATKLNELRLSTLIRLYEKKELDMRSICDFVLESSIPITSSHLGFMGFLNEDESLMTIHSWSKNTMQECAMHQKPLEFMVREGGIWGEAVRTRQPFMLNDFSLDSPLKKGTPEGHVAIRRFLAVPHLFNGKVVAVIALANKETPYTDDDVAQLRLLLEGMWQILRRKKAEEEAARHSEQIRHFANAVAHDLKSPAISVYGFAKMLKEKYAPALDERALRYCDQIMKSSKQISALAEDINTYITTRDTSCQFEPLALKEIWRTARQEFTPQLQERNIRWLEPEIERVQIVGNRIGLQRIFRNLIDNALKYGGKNLSEISMGYELSEKHHILLVENNGEGIQQEDEKIIFEEFKRKTTQPQIYGTGLGLAIVREIAAKHNGRSWLMQSSIGNPVFCVSISRHLTT